MHRVVLVDDEAIVLETFTQIVDWSGAGIEISCSARNGTEALNWITEHGADCVVTDIAMPGMDGLGLIRALKKNGYDLPVVVLSAFDEYRLVRSAFNLGISDYLVKTEVQPGELLRVVREALAGGGEKSTVPKTYQRDEALRSFLLDPKGTERGFPEGFHVPPSAVYTAVSAALKNGDAAEAEYRCHSLDRFMADQKQRIAEAIRGTGEIEGYAMDLGPENYCLVLWSADCPDYVFRERVKKALRAVDGTETAATALCYGIGPFVRDPRALHRTFLQAERTRIALFFSSRDNLRFHADLKALVEGETEDVPVEDFLRSLGSVDASELLGRGKGILDAIARAHPSSAEECRAAYLYFLMRFLAAAEELGAAQGTAQTLGLAERIAGWKTLDRVRGDVEGILEETLFSMDETGATSHSRPVERAIALVRERYTRSTFSIGEVCAEVGLTPAYFSGLFSREAGCTFTEYLASYRVKQARGLLRRTDRKVYEIAEMVGFGSVEHFSRTYKRIVGVSPRDYGGREP